MQTLTNDNLEQWQDAYKKMGTLLHGLQDVVQIVTGRKDVDIRLGTMTCTDGKTIFIEPPSEILEGKAVTGTIKARVYHETAHILYTQFTDDYGEKLMKKAQETHGSNFRDMYNAIEDARVEAILFRDFPGVEKHLHGHIDNLTRSVDFTKVDEDQQVIAGTYLMGARYPTGDLFTDRVEETLRTHADLIDRVGECGTSQAVFDLAEEVFQVFKEEGFFEEKEEEDNSDEGGPGEGSESEGFDNETTMGSKGKEGKTLLDQVRISRPTNVTDESAVDDSKAIQPAFDEGARVVGIKNGTVIGLAEDLVEDATDFDKMKAQKVMVDGAGTTGYLTSHLRAVFKDNAKTHFNGQYRSGRHINKRDLHKVATQTSDKVFSRRQKAGKVDYAVMIGVDCSGSMIEVYGGIQRIQRAAESALLLTKVLNNLDIPSKVVGYTTKPGLFGSEKARHIIYKNWDDNGSLSVLGRMMTMSAEAYNLDGYFLQEAHKELRQRRETKKILIVLSDGTPYFDSAFQIKLMRTSIAKMKREGIEVVGVGIAIQDVEYYYSNSVSVYKEDELGQKVVKALHDALLR